jgi:hypothetical protein
MKRSYFAEAPNKKRARIKIQPLFNPISYEKPGQR